MNGERIELRVHGSASLPALIYLPGVHGDWTLVSSFRAAVQGRVRFAEFTYPRTTNWTLADHAAQAARALAEQGIDRGWILAESFGSQIGWAMLEQGFRADGLILSGGFVRHPLASEVELARWLGRILPRWFLLAFLSFYRGYARFRHLHAPETLSAIDDFVTRRKMPGERAAIAHRLELIAEADFTAVASATHIPVFSLAGLWDPVVPWWPVQAWLRRECPGFQESHILLAADHAVLATQPEKSAIHILRWMMREAARERVRSRR